MVENMHNKKEQEEDGPKLQELEVMIKKQNE